MSKSLLLIGVLILAVLMLVAIFIIFLNMVFKRFKANRLNEKVNIFIGRNETGWYNFLFNNKPSLRYPNNMVTMMAIDKILVSYTMTVNNEEVLQRIAKYAALNMSKYYRKQLQSKDETVRLNVLQRTLLMNLEFLVPIIEQQLKYKHNYSTEEYLLWLRVVAKYNRNLFLAHMYKPRMKLDDYEYKLLLSNIDVDYIDYFKENFDQLPIRLRLALLDLLSVSTNLNDTYLIFYERLLKSGYLEIRIRALNAIAAFGKISDLDLYKTFVNSPHWEEQLLLAEILCFVTDEESYTYLQRLMYGSEWRVCRQAALSLKAKPKGPIILQQIITKKEDIYAVDMAKQVLEVV